MITISQITPRGILTLNIDEETGKVILITKTSEHTAKLELSVDDFGKFATKMAGAVAIIQATEKLDAMAARRRHLAKGLNHFASKFTDPDDQGNIQ